MDCKKESQPEFHHFHAGDVARYAKFYELRSNLTSDSTPLESFLWRKYFNARAAVLRDGERELGLLWLYGTEDEPYAAMPLAREEDLPACFAALQRYFREVLKKPLIVKLADEGAVRALQLPEDQYLVEEEENAADYLYDGNALRTLSGRKLHKKKNNYNNFIKNYGERYTYRPLEPGDHEAVLRFLEKWRDGKGDEVEDHLDREVEGIHDLLNHGEELDLGKSVSTGAILIDGELAAFSVGSLNRRDNMAVIHIEKANPEIDGLYQAINKEFLCHAFPEAAIINREDDVGLEGLRKSKQSYYPCGFAKKYLILERKGADLSDRQIQAEMQY